MPRTGLQKFMNGSGMELPRNELKILGKRKETERKAEMKRRGGKDSFTMIEFSQVILSTEPKIRNFYRFTFCFKNWVWFLSGITLKDPLLMRLEAIK